MHTGDPQLLKPALGVQSLWYPNLQDPGERSVTAVHHLSSPVQTYGHTAAGNHPGLTKHKREKERVWRGRDYTSCFLSLPHHIKKIQKAQTELQTICSAKPWKKLKKFEVRLKTGSCTTAAQQWSMQILWILVSPESRHDPFALCGSGCGKNVPFLWCQHTQSYQGKCIDRLSPHSYPKPWRATTTTRNNQTKQVQGKERTCPEP